MSAIGSGSGVHECPDRVAIETPSGSIRAGPVVECTTRIVDHQLVTHVRVQLDGHTLEVPERDATPP